MPNTGASWPPNIFVSDPLVFRFRSILYELIQVEHQIRERRAAYLPDLRERKGSNLLHVPASVPDGAPISPCAFDLVGRESFTALQSPQSVPDIGDPEQDP